MCPLQPVKLRISPVNDAQARHGANDSSRCRITDFEALCFIAREPGVIHCAIVCGARRTAESAETFRRMPRSDHRNSLVHMGTHPRNDDQSQGSDRNASAILG
jgi:hypothetical protein